MTLSSAYDRKLQKQDQIWALSRLFIYGKRLGLLGLLDELRTCAGTRPRAPPPAPVFLASITMNEKYCCAIRRQETSAALLRTSPFHCQSLRGALSLGRSVHRPRGEARQHSSLSSMDESKQEIILDEWPSDRRAALPCDVKVPDYNPFMAGPQPIRHTTAPDK